MSWDGKYWGQDGALASARAEYSDSAKTPHDMVRLASVYYSAATRAFAEVKRGRVWFGWHLLRCSNKAMNLAGKATHPTRLYSLTLDDIDVVLSIWSRFGNPVSIDVVENKRRMLRHAFERVDEGEWCRPHTKAFLQLHSFRQSGKKIDPQWLSWLEQLSAETALDGDYAQAARINRQIAQLLPRKDVNRIRLLNEAESLARGSKSTDQLIKMGLKP